MQHVLTTTAQHIFWLLQLFAADHIATLDEQQQNVHVEGDNKQQQAPPGSSVSYSSPDYGSMSSMALIVGGETHGLSRAAVHLLTRRAGLRLHIEMAAEFACLNSATAAALCMFEIRKQYMHANNT